MNPALRSSSSIEHFKLNLKKTTTPFFPHLYSRFIGKAAVNHTRIRLELSALNFQRFQYNFGNNMSCDKCGARREDAAHLLFHCPAYAVPRQSFSHYITFYLTIYSDLKNILSKSYCMAQKP